MTCNDLVTILNKKKAYIYTIDDQYFILGMGVCKRLDDEKGRAICVRFEEALQRWEDNQNEENLNSLWQAFRKRASKMDFAKEGEKDLIGFVNSLNDSEREELKCQVKGMETIHKLLYEKGKAL